MWEIRYSRNYLDLLQTLPWKPSDIKTTINTAVTSLKADSEKVFMLMTFAASYSFLVCCKLISSESSRFWIHTSAYNNLYSHQHFGREARTWPFSIWPFHICFERILNASNVKYCSTSMKRKVQHIFSVHSGAWVFLLF